MNIYAQLFSSVKQLVAIIVDYQSIQSAINYNTFKHLFVFNPLTSLYTVRGLYTTQDQIYNNIIKIANNDNVFNDILLA